MAGKRKIHGGAFKAQVALAAHKGDRTVNELAGHYGVHPTLIHAWKKQLITGAVGIFESPAKAASADAEARQAELFEQIGRLKMELEWLKKKAAPSGGGRKVVGGGRPPGVGRPPPVRATRAEPLDLLLRADRRDVGRPALDATDRRTVYRLPVLRQPENHGGADPPRGGGQSEAGPAADADHGPGGDLSEAKTECSREGT